MDPTIVAVAGLAALVIMIVLGVPIGFTMMIVGAVGLALLLGVGRTWVLLSQIPVTSVGEYAFLVIPLFLLMGNLAAGTGIVENAYRVLRNWLGHLPGGLAMATALANIPFGAVSGSSMAATALFTRVAVPQMLEAGYDRALAIGTVASSGVIAQLIPPSMLILFYCLLTDVSVGKVFLAGVVPGIMEGVAFAAMIFVRCRMNPKLAPPTPLPPFRQRFTGMPGLWPLIVIAGLVLGGIYLGWFTPTEAAAVGAFSTLAMSVILRKFSWGFAKGAIRETVLATSMVFLMYIGITMLSYFLAYTMIPRQLVQAVTESGLPSLVVLGLIVLVYLILGMVMEGLPLMALTLPLIFPLLIGLGYNPIWLGIFVVKLGELAIISPPVGITLFTAQATYQTMYKKRLNLEEIYRGVMPFFFVDIGLLVLLVVFPQIATFLPNLMK